MREANVLSVREYLMRVYHMKASTIAELMDVQHEELQRGISFRSHADYVGDAMAKAAGLEHLFDEEACEEWDAQWEEADD